MRRLLVNTRPYRALMYGASPSVHRGRNSSVGPLLTRTGDRRRGADAQSADRDRLDHAVFFLALLTEFVMSYGSDVAHQPACQRVIAICDGDLRAFSSDCRSPTSTETGRQTDHPLTSDVETLNELFTSGVVADLAICSR